MDKKEYKHINYGVSLNFKDSTLPQDKRKYPWPYIRKYELDVKTWAEYYRERCKLIEDNIFQKNPFSRVFND